MNIERHGPANSTSCPRLGAMTGTIKNTTKVSDMTRARRRPEYKSRMTERVTTTLAAARPCSKRHASSAAKLVVRPHSTAAATYIDSPISSTGRRP